MSKPRTQSSLPPEHAGEVSSGAINRHPVAAYVILAYAITWLAAIPLITGAAEERFHLMLALGPAVAAVIVTALVSGRPGLAALWERCRDWRRFTGWIWWPISASPIAFLAVGLAIAAITGDLAIDWSMGFGEGGWPFGLVLASVMFGVLEEIGWRGFLLPRLQWHRTASRASLILWLLWGGWHAPMFLYHFDMSPVMMLGWATGLYFGTVFLTFLLNSTRGSLMSVIVFHVSLNLASITAAEVSEVALVVVNALVILSAIVAARTTGGNDLSRHQRFTIAVTGSRRES